MSDKNPEDRRKRDRERYHNDPVSRAKQRERQNAWHAARFAGDPQFVRDLRVRDAKRKRDRWHEDPEWRANKLARDSERSWLKRGWGLTSM